MQLQDIVGEIRKTLGEVEPNGYNSQLPGDGTWDNSQIIGYINEAIGLLNQIARRETTASIALNTTTNVYNLPTDCLENGVRKILYNATGALGPVPIKPIGVDEYERLLLNPPNTGVGLGGYRYTLWGGQILLTPYPQHSTDTLTVLYYKTMADLVNATDVPDFPKRFHVALVHYATAMCQKATEETGLFQMEMNNYNGVVGEMRAELSRNSRDRNRVRRR